MRSEEDSLASVTRSVVAIIPARGGSKGIPGKNLRVVGGVPLVARAVAAARGARGIDAVVVSTDDAEIGRVARAAGALIVERPAGIAGDEASSESALLHALDMLEVDGSAPDVVVFIQSTSPLIDPLDLDEAVARVVSGDAEVVFSATATHAFLWRDAGPAHGVVGVNHDRASRPRRQDRAPEYRETGAFYVMDAAGFRSARHRFFGRVAVQLVPERHGLDIDTAADLELARAIAAIDEESLDEAAVHMDAIDVDAVVTDFDGVHTDDSAFVDADGHESVRVSRADGHGVRLLREAGVPVMILSAERNDVVMARGRKLQVEVVHGVDGDDARGDKGDVLTAWSERVGVPLERVAYVGNDVGDLPALRLVGWPIAVSDAHPSVRAVARVVLAARGGDGAVRELADRVIAAHRRPSLDPRPAGRLTEERRSS
ncbi:acylneuraminate cytidylyltransferase [Labedella populi]|uniref:N-acylneuraminate cytidylyltransferase n=2 Tax=Labedella populi TaxID=2498850 RepID=A0A444QGQ1_9MICO|nr:acylneuraminate cytidylyltransferase [Labedella populi]